MATDYDAPRTRPEDAPADPGLREIEARTARPDSVMGDELDPFETELAMPGADLDTSDLTMTVLPKQHDEFTCSACYLVYHRSQLADPARGRCRDCAR